MKLAALGTAGYLPAAGRQTMSFLLATGTETLLLDAGSGVARLLEPQIARLLPADRRLDVLLSHYHLDHVVGLSYLLGLAADRPIGDALAYVTDTVIDAATADFVRGVKLLLHEVWLTEEEAATSDPSASGHSHAGAVADLARSAGVGKLWIVHHHPRRSAAELAQMAGAMSARAGLPVEVPVEGEVYELE